MSCTLTTVVLIFLLRRRSSLYFRPQTRSSRTTIKLSLFTIMHSTSIRRRSSISFTSATRSKARSNFRRLHFSQRQKSEKKSHLRLFIYLSVLGIRSIFLVFCITISPRSLGENTMNNFSQKRSWPYKKQVISTKHQNYQPRLSGIIPRLEEKAKIVRPVTLNRVAQKDARTSSVGNQSLRVSEESAASLLE